jgi:hypothetical protein
MAGRLSALRTGLALLPRNIFSASDTRFCWTLSKPQGLVRLEGLRKLKEFIRLVRSRTRGLPAYSIAPQPLRYRVTQDLHGLGLLLSGPSIMWVYIVGHVRNLETAYNWRADGYPLRLPTTRRILRPLERREAVRQTSVTTGLMRN